MHTMDAHAQAHHDAPCYLLRLTANYLLRLTTYRVRRITTPANERIDAEPVSTATHLDHAVTGIN